MNINISISRQSTPEESLDHMLYAFSISAIANFPKHGELDRTDLLSYSSAGRKNSAGINPACQQDCVPLRRLWRESVQAIGRPQLPVGAELGQQNLSFTATASNGQSSCPYIISLIFIFSNLASITTL